MPADSFMWLYVIVIASKLINYSIIGALFGLLLNAVTQWTRKFHIRTAAVGGRMPKRFAVYTINWFFFYRIFLDFTVAGFVIITTFNTSILEITVYAGMAKSLAFSTLVYFSLFEIFPLNFLKTNRFCFSQVGRIAIVT